MMKPFLTYYVSLAFLLFSGTVAQFQQPSWRDEVHAVWVNGPTHSAQLGGKWPRFDSWGGSGNSQCSLTNPDVRFTGYTSSGGFCKASPNALDQNPHLVIYSGNLGLVLDASASSGNLFPKIDSTSGYSFPNGVQASEVYGQLQGATVTASLTVTCPDLGTTVVTARPLLGSMAEFGLVRQGHAVTHVTVDGLEWTTGAGEKYIKDAVCAQTPVVYPNAFTCDANYGGSGSNACPDPAYPTCTTGTCYSDPLVDSNTICSTDFGVGAASVSNPCETSAYPTCTNNKCVADRIADPSGQNCNQDYGGGSWPCLDPAYPDCQDFIQGQQWGRCYSVPTNNEDCDGDYGATAGSCPTEAFPICNGNGYCSKDPTTCHLAKPWFDVTMWGDSIALHLNWDGTATGCTGTVQLDVQMASTMAETSADITTSTAKLLLSNDEGTSSLVKDTVGAGLNDVTVVSSGSQVQPRVDYGDIMVEVPGNTPSCQYNHCGNILAEVDVTVSNSNPSEMRTVRLTLSRNFETRYGLTKSGIGAEITGLNVMVWDKSTNQPNGIPLHISKNWHSGFGDSIYAGTWWTANVLFHLPASSSTELTFAIAYEQFKGIPAWSHSQLSIVGYSNKWLWEEAALGTGGENFVMDPMGSHTRAVITDVRPKLFDGKWKENVGGGDFLLYFDQAGVFQYKKELDAQLQVNGPNLSNATYTSLSLDGTIKSKIQISGGRTDDLVRVFINIRHEAIQPTSFSRLAFFQMSGETYNYHATFQDFVFGNSGGVTHNFARTCSAGTNRASSNMYDSVNSGTNMYKEMLPGQGPWWVALGPNTDPVVYSTDDMVVGDRGLVIRSYEAKFGGAMVTNPSVSVLCDKVELGPPLGLDSLLAGDYVNIQLEMLVLPRPQDFNIAVTNSPNSNALQYLNGLSTTWERVQAQADRDIKVTKITAGGVLESHYPIRVSMAANAGYVQFTVSGKALGYAPLVVCNLDSPDIPAGHGIWKKESGNTNYQFLTDETNARQANYDRISGKYELVFNVEIGVGSTTTTEFAFGPDPATQGAFCDASAWCIDFDKIVSSSVGGDAGGDDIVLKYAASQPSLDTSNDKFYEVRIMDETCTTHLPNEAVTTTNLLTPGDRVPFANYDSNEGTLTLGLDIDTTQIETSSLSTIDSANIIITTKFCVRVDLKATIDVGIGPEEFEIGYDKVVITMTTNKEKGFEISLEAQALETEVGGTSEIDIDYDVQNCLCNENAECLQVAPPPFKPGELFHFCIFTGPESSSFATVTGLRDVNFINDLDIISNNNPLTIPIIKGDGNPIGPTKVAKDCTTVPGVCRVTAVAYARLYEKPLPDGTLQDISTGNRIGGTSIMTFTGRRRDRQVLLRKLQQQQQQDADNTYTILKDSEEQPGGRNVRSGFDLKIEMARPPTRNGGNININGGSGSSSDGGASSSDSYAFGRGSESYGNGGSSSAATAVTAAVGGASTMMMMMMMMVGSLFL